MLRSLKSDLAERIGAAVRGLYDHDLEVEVSVPPRRELGDLAFPAALHLARRLKRNPRDIASEIAERVELPAEVLEVRVEGAGYLNLFLDRSAIAARLLTDPILRPDDEAGGKVIVEHTNINPNKAAHIGHLRNAVLGDVLGRVLRSIGREVEIQNYIDDTGVQLADVVVGFIDIEGKGLAEVEAIGEPFDYYCWDLYSRVGHWYEADPDRLEIRRATLHEMEGGSGPRADLGRLVSQRIVDRHLKTMARLGIDYDLLTHESAILGLDFFARAFELLEEAGAVHLEEGGRNAGCWVMPLSESEEFSGLEDPDKVIVRSDGTVTYVGKDIAYQLWKFGLLGLDFRYRYWDAAGVWETGCEGVEEHPAFGRGDRVINVIDARQSYLQKVVRAGLEALGYRRQAAASIHFAYEMVSLSTATARQLGYLDAGDDGGRALEMSGRKGIGVKADDLIDQLVRKSREEIATRNRDMSDEQLDDLARRIATAALRYFMIKFSTTRVIAFDLDDALSFEGDSGPYLQYSMVRAHNIRRRLEKEGIEVEVGAERVAALPREVWGDDLWDLVLSVAQIPETVQKAGDSLELSTLGRRAQDLAQRFHAIYHRHPILQESDAELRSARLATTEIFTRGLGTLTELLGIPIPERM
jgi:arginyl-tRNA synthetase